MNSSEQDSLTEQRDGEGSSANRIHSELLRARSGQKRLYLFIALFLLMGMLFTIGVITFSNGTVIAVLPEEAQATAAVDLVGGFGTTIGHTVYSLSGNPMVRVSATGFRSLRRTIGKSETGGTVTVELSELPGQIRLSTRPGSKGTRWIIDGQMRAIAATLNRSVSAGTHEIEIDSPYYRKRKIRITVERGTLLKLAPALQRVSGHLNIKTIPPGASIRIDGNLAGVSPLSLVREGGKYHIEVVRADYQTVSEDIEITNAERVIERNYRLAVQDAYLYLHMAPSGGKFLLDGKVVSPEGPLAVPALADHTLVYLKEGYFPQQRIISVTPGSKRRVSFSLQPETGRVSFLSVPDATVYLDGRDRGKTPLTLTLSAIPHHVELRKRGYRTYRQVVIPGSKSAQRISVSLSTEQQAILAETPEQYHNSAGIVLKRFRPDGLFVMGAPRSEKGQRANEFLRRVRLTRPFYISVHEVTRSQYAAFRQGKGQEAASAGGKSGSAPFLRQPVTLISWIEAARYCNWLSRNEKITPFYDIRNGRLRGSNARAKGYRLPSEAEWEWLARVAGRSGQTRFTWGDETVIPPKSGNIADEYARGKTEYYVSGYSDGYAAIAPVGSYPPEKSGLYDLTGNVSEWMHDVYVLTPPDGKQTEIDPLGARLGDTHTVKGSNWRSGRLTELRASYREGEKDGRDDIGFRVARYVY